MGVTLCQKIVGVLVGRIVYGRLKRKHRAAERLKADGRPHFASKSRLGDFDLDFELVDRTEWLKTQRLLGRRRTSNGNTSHTLFIVYGVSVASKFAVESVLSVNGYSHNTLGSVANPRLCKTTLIDTFSIQP